MNGLGSAWMVGLGIVVWRQVHQSHRLPIPANLLGVTGLFVAFGLLADIAPPARQVIMLTAWGLDIAGLITPHVGILDQGFMGQIFSAQSAEATASGTSSASSGGGGNG